jgi:hypothetical protein
MCAIDRLVVEEDESVALRALAAALRVRRDFGGVPDGTDEIFTIRLPARTRRPGPPSRNGTIDRFGRADLSPTTAPKSQGTSAPDGDDACLAESCTSERATTCTRFASTTLDWLTSLDNLRNWLRLGLQARERE